MTAAWFSSPTAGSGCPMWTRSSTSRGDPTPEHVVGPGLVDQDGGQEYHHDDGHYLECVRRGRGVLDGQVGGRALAGDHHVRIEIAEDRQYHAPDRHRGGDEGPAPAAHHDQPGRGEDGDQGGELSEVEQEAV